MNTQPIEQEPAGSGRDVPIGYLRTFLVLLVVLHHSVLAYCTYAPPPGNTLDTPWMAWSAFPVADTARWRGADLIVGFNDTFFMSLFFLISGIFLWSSLTRKSTNAFLRDRALRLGIPFLFAAAVLAPLAYYPAYLMTGAATPFWQQWLALSAWPAGPAWFLWVLLAFDVMALIAFKLAPTWGKVLGRISGRLSVRPIVYFIALLGVSALTYLPLAAMVSPLRWSSFGPFFFQTSRILHYAVYFVAGAGIGSFGLGRGLLAHDGKLARRWSLWLLTALAAFVLAVVTSLATLSTLQHGGPSAWLSNFGNVTFVLSCACSSFAFLALFLRFAKRANRVYDSLSANAYGIFLLHYACVSWLQLSLLGEPLPGAGKALLVFVGAVLLSWSLSAALRRVPIIRRVV